MAPSRYPPIADYALISDCHCMALVSRAGSIDWCCMPRVDAASIFGRLLDWDRGGYCALTPAEERFSSYRNYLPGSMILATTISTNGGEARILDLFSMHEGGREHPDLELIRVVEGVRGRVDFKLEIQPRFDYGEVKPWLRRGGDRLFAAIGGNDGLLIGSDVDLEPVDQHDLRGSFSVRADEKVRLSISYRKPERLDQAMPDPVSDHQIDHRVQRTLEWWQHWVEHAKLEGPDGPGALRSALILRALTNAPTGAVAAAATTSLPEQVGGARNWDYRFSWIRDSSFSVRSLADMGCTKEADGFRRFIQRSAAGSARDLQIMYGVGGERRLTELVLDKLEGYRRSKPVRIGNAASQQLQLDAYGELVLLSWRWHRRGYSPDDDYWRFLVDLVEVAAERWTEPDHGIWEIRGPRLHFVHSKAMCWVAVDRGLAMARECARKVPTTRWAKLAREMREVIEAKGYDAKRGVFTQAFGRRQMDAALLLLPTVGFVEWTDERMVRTVDQIRRELEVDGFLLRYRTDQVKDGLQPGEGVFISCTFWLAEALARQGRFELAREYFDRAVGTSNDVGLYAEEYDPAGGSMLGNFPQALSHLSHIASAVALAEVNRSATRGD